ncbi:MAG TPA: hypothetical protein VNF26_00885 [Candidatus Baltobacterales bacterium]|nr:hypothetical protein [Candidatus Baltobacterales bacterium]
MYQYKQEEVAWERVKDLQREIENSRLMAAGLGRSFAALGLLAQRAWLLAGLATRRPPRPRSMTVEREIEEANVTLDAA